MVNKKIIGVSLGILLLIVLIYGLGFFGVSFNKLSGRAVLDLTANYQEGQPIEGVLTLSLKKGELIPASSKILFKTPEQTYEYDLAEFITDEVIEGDFYLEGQSISGNGLGYGVIGEKIIYPKVDFTLDIYSPKTEGSLSQSEEVVGEEIVEGEIIEDDTTPPEDTILDSEEPVSDSQVDGGLLDEEPVEEPSEPEIEEVEVSNQELGEVEQTANEEVEQTANEEVEGASITGGIIKTIFKTIANFFLGITPTGQVSLEFETEINGEVSADEPFIYTLQEGQTAEIVSSSQNVELNIQGNEVIVTTDYSETEQGFGKDYLKDIGKEIIIDLSSLNLMVEEGGLEVSLVYGGEAIISFIASEEEILPEITEEGIAKALSDAEKKILFEKFGNSVIKITKAKLDRGRIVRRYELGEYWFEPSYDSNLAEDLIIAQIEEDRIRWLQDIANTLLQKEIMSEEIEISEKEIKIF